jgi:hypothetical protein
VFHPQNSKGLSSKRATGHEGIIDAIVAGSHRAGRGTTGVSAHPPTSSGGRLRNPSGFERRAHGPRRLWMGHSQRSGSPSLPFTRGLKGDRLSFRRRRHHRSDLRNHRLSRYLRGAIDDRSGGCRFSSVCLDPRPDKQDRAARAPGPDVS